MTPHGETAYGAERMDPRHFARRAKHNRDNEESVVSRHFAPMPGPVSDDDEGIAPQYPETVGNVGTREVRPEAAHKPDAPRSFAVLQGQKHSILAEQKAGWSQWRPVVPEEIVRRWPTDPATEADA